jgi:hypothetical protein
VTRHVPSTRLGACDPCRNNDHAACWEARRTDPPLPSDDSVCTCYDDSWEWHDALHFGLADPASPP